MENLQQLIREVEKAKENIRNLKKLLVTYKNNKTRGSHNVNMEFYVGGYNSATAECIDEDIFHKAVELSIEHQEKLMADKFKTVEAMEMLATNQIVER